jgi:hypothetical protein
LKREAKKIHSPKPNRTLFCLLEEGIQKKRKRKKNHPQNRVQSKKKNPNNRYRRRIKSKKKKYPKNRREK